MEPDTFYHYANVCFVNEKYDDAARNLTSAIELVDDNFRYYAHRAEVYLKIGRLKEALQDIDKALNLNANDDVCLHRRGKILFALQRYTDAKTCFSARSRSDDTDLWLRKCDAEINGDALVIPVASNSTGNEDAADTQVCGQVEPTVKKEAKIKHEWYQSTNQINISIFVKNRKEDDITIEFTPNSFSVSVKLDDAPSFTLSRTTYAEIVPAESHFEVTAGKVIIKLGKVHAKNWLSLDKLPERGPEYPTSNKQKKDWSNMDILCQKELDNEKPEGDEALNTLFRDIYGNADESTRRAMVKSFQTSGGTVLSTNWNEVQKADYEGKDRPDAPDGQAWAKK